MSLPTGLPVVMLIAAVAPPIPAVGAAAGEAGDERPPNVVLIFSDDQGIGDVGCYGGEIPTPHIDSLARDGAKFTSWYSASSICTPSRFGLLTGRNPSRSRDGLLGALMFLGDEDAGRGIRPGETTIAEVLHDQGYRTALIGKWHLGHGDPEFLPTRHGFDLFRGHTGGCIDYFTMTYGIVPDWYEGEEHVRRDGYATELITDEAVRFLADQEDAPAPFFLYLAYNAPHFGKGYDPGTGQPVNIMQPRDDELHRVSGIEDVVRRQYAAMVVALDDGVGRVLEALESHGLEDDTIVLFITDHGGDPVYGGSNAPYRGGKATLFEGGIRVPALIRWPGRVDAGRVVDEVAGSIDVAPTLTRLAGAALEGPEVEGRDLAPLLLDGEPLGDRELFWETGQHDQLGRGRWTALRRGRWKYVEDDAGEEYLFDLDADPSEGRNLAGDHPDVLNRLRARRDARASMGAGAGAGGR